ncbi:MAG: type IV pilus twitching motility protein PilT [Endomicrobiales bacterium]|nr:type IV pilus twitching motility protein PilT [Endomicrobiales bacterium]
MDIKVLLAEMIKKGASDLHVRAGSPSVLRIDGDLITMEGNTFSNEETISIANSLMNDTQKAIFQKHHEIDLGVTFPDLGRFRINAFTQRGIVNMAVRAIPIKIPTIDELKLPPVIKQIAENRRGLIIVTGITGSGKSTTLASIIGHINNTRPVHIVTIEDPIEFIHKDNKSIITQRELGIDTLSYPDALKHVVRQDPDVILLGEMRDVHTVTAAITAAQTGHLVISTLHTIDATQSVNRIIDFFPPHQQDNTRIMLADTLKAVISQRLLPHTSGKGRVPAVEVMIVNALIKKLIEDKNTAEIVNQIRKGEYYGMQTFNQALMKLFKDNEIKLEDALGAATNPEELMLNIRGVQSGTDDASSSFIER